MALEKELEVGRAIACQAAELALQYRERGIRAEIKRDLSPVTAADRDSERLIARILEEKFPGDGLIGEEGALRKSTTGRRWIIDPLDGTRDYLRGNPTWGVLLALEVGTQLGLGICHLPERGELYFAIEGGGAWRNDTRIRVSDVAEPANALLCINGFHQAASLPFSGRLLEWLQRFWAVRSFGGSTDAMLVASGRAEAWIEAAAEPWDLAALKIICEEAGAVFFNFDGHSSIYGGNCAVAVPALAAELRKFVLGAARAGTNAPVQAPL